MTPLLWADFALALLAGSRSAMVRSTPAPLACAPHTCLDATAALAGDGEREPARATA